MEINLVLDIAEALLSGFLFPFRVLIENIDVLAQICMTLNKMKPINLLCIGLGIPTITITVLRLLIKKAIFDK